jgi:hypothetical protein
MTEGCVFRRAGSREVWRLALCGARISHTHKKREYIYSLWYIAKEKAYKYVLFLQNKKIKN